MDPEPVVFIIDDDPAVRDALAVLVRSVGLRTQTYATAHEFLDTYDPVSPGCLVLDIRMPGMGGLELQEELDARRIRLPVIVVTGHGDMQTAVRAMKAGALDCFAKPFNDQELLDCIHRAIRRDGEVRKESARRSEIESRMAQLSPREREVMEGIVAGKTNQTIADELGVTKKTIDAHRAKVMEKTETRSLAELVELSLKLREGSRC